MEQSLTSKASILGNSHIVFVKIIIGSEEISDSNFKVNITQKVAEHDTFEVICPTEALEGFGAYPMASSRDYLGEKITIKLVQFGADAYSFSGIITAIKNKKFDGYEGHIILSGFSPTILLENGLDCQSYQDQSLKEIITNATQGYAQDSLSFILKPNHTTQIPYTVQYKESDFAFIKRLAVRYGEWLYYNGQKIVFGKNNEDTVDLEEESEMFEYEMKMQVVPQSFKYMAYHSDAANQVTESSDAVQKTNYNNPFLNHAVKISEKVYQKTPVAHYNHSLMQNGSGDLNHAVQLQKDKRANVFFVEGKSRKPDLKIGSFIKMKGIVNGEKSFSGGTVPLETYRIVSLTNHHDGLDDYYNTFMAVPFEIIVPEYMNDDAVPRCDEQSATVTNNNDPKGLGRVQVQLSWQKNIGQNTPWIRMTNPHAGGGKGTYFIPEIGEEVLVGFENGNAEKPFVLGAMYNGNETSGYSTAGNDQKVIQTRSGTKIIMNDAIGSVFIEDPSGNTWMMDGKGNINVNAPNTISMNATDIIMTASKNITYSAGMNISESAGVDKSTSIGMMHNLFVGGDSMMNVTGNVIEYITGDKKSHTEKERMVTAEKKIQTNTNGSTEHHSKKEIQHNSAEKSKLH